MHKDVYKRQNEDYKTVILVRKLSMALMLLSGFVMAILFSMVSGPLAASVLGAKKTPELSLIHI